MSRLDKLKEQHPELNVSLIDIIASVEPSETYKYMGFLIKILKNEYYKKGDVQALHRSIVIKLFEYENLALLIDFEKHSRANRLSNPDISHYKNFNDIKKEVNRADDVVKLKELEKQVKKLYETDFWLVIIPLSFEASKMYGANTKWCTTQERHWDDYKSKYKLIYIINKKSNVKYAVSSSTTEDKVQGWLANDKESNPMLWSIPNEVMGVLIEEVKKRESVIELAKNHGIAVTIQQSKKQNAPLPPHFRDDIDIDDVRRIANELNQEQQYQERNEGLQWQERIRVEEIMRRLDDETNRASEIYDNDSLPF
jgi:hypothetical protein